MSKLRMGTFNIEYENFCEQTIALALAKRKGALLLPNQPGKNSDKDFTLMEPVDYESKCQRKADKTGNAFLETWNTFQNAPSGLTVTKAHWWVVYAPSRAMLYQFCPKNMLQFCQSQKVMFKENAGDGNSNGYVLPLDRMQKIEWVESFKFPPL